MVVHASPSAALLRTTTTGGFMKLKFATFIAAALAAVPIGTLVVGTATSASAAPAHCTKSASNATPPTAPTAYGAGAAGSVTVGPLKHGLTVASVSPNSGWSSRVDTATGNSVDVFFQSGTTRIKFEAGIESPTRLHLVVRTCG
jgi:hypothetical protein